MHYGAALNDCRRGPDPSVPSDRCRCELWLSPGCSACCAGLRRASRSEGPHRRSIRDGDTQVNASGSWTRQTSAFSHIPSRRRTVTLSGSDPRCPQRTWISVHREGQWTPRDPLCVRAQVMTDHMTDHMQKFQSNCL